MKLLNYKYLEKAGHLQSCITFPPIAFFKCRKNINRHLPEAEKMIFVSKSPPALREGTLLHFLAPYFVPSHKLSIQYLSLKPVCLRLSPDYPWLYLRYLIF